MSHFQSEESAMVTAHKFLSPEPEVAIENIFEHPYENAVATARTCYSSKGIITAAQVSGEGIEDSSLREKRAKQRDAIALSIYKAGHHTTLQHAHVQFRLANISRQFIWSFLHSHPFYNSEQVSQRYVEVRPGNVIIPPLQGEALSTYENTVQAQMAAYQKLVELLEPVVQDAYFTIFPARRGKDKYSSEVKKKAQEVARYVLPIGTFAYMYHTVSVVTLLRYYRTCLQYDVPLEQREVVGKMVRCLLDKDPQFEKILEEPVGPEQNPEFELLERAEERQSRQFVEEFDRSLDGLTSKLIDWKGHNEEVIAQCVREVFGLTRSQLSDDEALERLLDPSRNVLLGSSLNLSANSKLMRAMVHAGYTFRKKMSHAGDSQDQRHRTIPASRPCLQAHLSDAPDYIEPGLVSGREEIREYYRQVMELIWGNVSKLRRLGVSPEFCVYLLPNSVAIRFTESADLLNLRHKMAMRLCYNAQEEIWKASLEEAAQIRELNPRIGKYLLPPCSLRYLAKERPICPEGNRYCGIPVWRLDLKEYQRLL